MTLKKYWRRCSMKDLEIIQAKTIKFLQADNPELLQLRYPTAYNVLDFDQYTTAVPEMLTAFDHLGIKVITIAAYVMHEPKHGAAHRDSTEHEIRINLPILNCQGSWTRFWILKDPTTEPKEVILPNGIPYRPYKLSELICVDQVEITEPTAIRPKEIHTITANPKLWPRITLTLEVDSALHHWLD